MKKRVMTALVGVMGIAIAAAGCSSSDGGGGTGGTTEEKPYVALISKGFRHQFWQAVKDGAEQAGEEFNITVTFEGAQEEGNVEQQIQLLQTTLDKHPNAIGVERDRASFDTLSDRSLNDVITELPGSDDPILAPGEQELPVA